MDATNESEYSKSPHEKKYSSKYPCPRCGGGMQHVYSFSKGWRHLCIDNEGCGFTAFEKEMEMYWDGYQKALSIMMELIEDMRVAIVRQERKGA